MFVFLKYIYPFIFSILPSEKIYLLTFCLGFTCNIIIKLCFKVLFLKFYT